MSTELVEKILSAGVLPHVRRGHVSPVKLDTTALPGGSLVMLLFVNDEAEPSYVLRTPRTPRQPQRILTNFNSLRYLSQVRPVARSVPRAVFCGDLDGLLTSIETCVPGLPLAVNLRIARHEGRRDDAAHLFGLGAQWLWNLHAATRAKTPLAPCGQQDAEASATKSICALRDEGLLTTAQAASLLSAVRLANGPTMPVSRVHGDYNPNNMLLDRRKGVSVIDWEFSRTGWALWDLFTLARTAWFHPAGVPEPSATLAQEVWDPRTPFGRAFAVALRRYEQAWGIHRAHCRLLFGVYIAQYLTEQLGLPPLPSVPEAWKTLLLAAVEY